jgi:hypothetical protein
MCSRSYRPLGLPIYVARVPTAPFARSYPRHFTLSTRSPRRPCASYPAALPSSRAMPDRDVFYVADPISSIRAVTTGSSTEPSSSTAASWNRYRTSLAASEAIAFSKRGSLRIGSQMGSRRSVAADNSPPPVGLSISFCIVSNARSASPQ